jgi:phosphohistidine phosphatase
MMLFVVRHAKAHDRDPREWPDDSERPLTKGGARRFAALARAVAERFDPPSVVLASSYVRAWQTAKLLEENALWPPPERASILECDEDASAEVICAWLARAVRGAESAALVGHEPVLSELVSELLGCHGPGVAMAKGAIAVLRVRDPALLLEAASYPGSCAELLALVEPRWLGTDE